MILEKLLYVSRKQTIPFFMKPEVHNLIRIWTLPSVCNVPNSGTQNTRWLTSFNNGHSMYPPVTSPHDDIHSMALRRAKCYTETLGEWGIRYEQKHD
jgi:hypothetical protein